MQKSKKNFLGLLGLAFVAAMTVFAYLLPANGAYAEGASDWHTDVIRVTVYDRFPAIKIDDPETDYISTSPELTVTFTYENSQYVDFTISYNELDADGNVVVDLSGDGAYRGSRVRTAAADIDRTVDREVADARLVTRGNDLSEKTGEVGKLGD